MTTLQPHTPAVGAHAKSWRWVPAILLTSSLLGWSVMVRLALDDPGFAVEPDYYKKASRWDDHKRDQARSLATGWRATLAAEPSGSGLRVSLFDARGEPLKGAQLVAQAFANARAADVRQLTFNESAPGVYNAKLLDRHSGLWEVRVHAKKGDQTYDLVQRVDLISPHPESLR